jgi:hypothetical protein
MGGFVVIAGKRQSVNIDRDGLQKIAEILGIRPFQRSQVTAVSVVISSPPSPPEETAATSRPRGRAQRSTPSGSTRSSARSTRRPRQE